VLGDALASMKSHCSCVAHNTKDVVHQIMAYCYGLDGKDMWFRIDFAYTPWSIPVVKVGASSCTSRRTWRAPWIASFTLHKTSACPHGNHACGMLTRVNAQTAKTTAAKRRSTLSRWRAISPRKVGMWKHGDKGHSYGNWALSVTAVVHSIRFLLTESMNKSSRICKLSRSDNSSE
jgi:hypothetical protein